MGHFWIVYDTGLVLCQIALWDCLGDEFLTRFPVQHTTEIATASPKLSHSALGHTTARTHVQLQDFKMALPSP